MSRRTDKVASLIHIKLGELVTTKLKDPRIGFVTITRVAVTPDLKEARVYYSVLGQEKEKSDAGRGLEHAAGFMQHEIADDLKLRFTPKLTFHLDESLEESLKIQKILRELEKES
ncbi:MAG: 30S ribosome-binding factor RbfA [Candidatus Omnitrophica bacterium]|nr:30S ribosome-binding factor RbfA [Candidatus Omnitrophota bacterium]